MESRTNILDLNFKVLAVIFSHIEDIDDEFNFAQAHPILFDVFAYCNRERVRNLQIAYFNRDQFSKLLPIFGPYVEHIELYNNGSPFDLIGEYCTSLQKITMHYCVCSLKSGDWQCLWQIETIKVIELTIDSCDSCNCGSYNGHIKIGSIVNMLEDVRNLKELSLCSFPGNELNALKDLNNLEILKIVDCGISKNLFNLCSQMTKLRVLQIAGTTYDVPKLFNVGPYIILPHCRNLTELTVECSHVSLDTLFQDSIAEYAKHLEKLHIPKLTNSESAHILGELSALKELKCVFDYELVERITKLQNLKRLFIDLEGSHDILPLLSVIRYCENLELLQVENYYNNKNSKIETVKMLTKTDLQLNVVKCNRINIITELKIPKKIEII